MSRLGCLKGTGMYPGGVVYKQRLSLLQTEVGHEQYKGIGNEST